jgi:drug/metabolite transporter (DMT)-like permease
MNWFLFALAAPFLWAFVNIADNFLVAKYSEKEKERSSGGLVLFSSFIAIFIAGLIAIFVSGIFDISFLDKLLLFVTGILTIIWIILYLFTLETEDVSTIAPYFLTVPIFGYILGYIFLGETLTNNQLIGTLVVLIGLVFISMNFSKEKRKFKWKPVFYMLGACFLVAISGVIFKYVTVGNNFWISSFWEYFGMAVTGIVMFALMPKYRAQFLHMSRTGGKKIFTLNMVTELMTISGNLLTNFALLLAPVVMVYIVGAFQPAIVLLLMIICTKFFPHIAKEDLSWGILIPKIMAIIIMIMGSIILFM